MAFSISYNHWIDIGNNHLCRWSSCGHHSFETTVSRQEHTIMLQCTDGNTNQYLVLGLERDRSWARRAKGAGFAITTWHVLSSCTNSHAFDRLAISQSTLDNQCNTSSGAQYEYSFRILVLDRALFQQEQLHAISLARNSDNPTESRFVHWKCAGHDTQYCCSEVAIWKSQRGWVFKQIWLCEESPVSLQAKSSQTVGSLCLFLLKLVTRSSHLDAQTRCQFCRLNFSTYWRRSERSGAISTRGQPSEFSTSSISRPFVSSYPSPHHHEVSI